jgi:hypothetical protein
MKKSVIERYNHMDIKSSEEEWNDDFGTMVLEVLEKALRNGELTKTVEDLVDEIEIRFKEAVGLVENSEED